MCSQLYCGVKSQNTYSDSVISTRKLHITYNFNRHTMKNKVFFSLLFKAVISLISFLQLTYLTQGKNSRKNFLMFFKVYNIIL